MRCQLRCLRIIVFACLSMRALNALDVDGLKQFDMSHVFTYRMQSWRCIQYKKPYVETFSRPVYAFSGSDPSLKREIWSRLLLYAPKDEVEVTDSMDILSYSHETYGQIPAQYRMWRRVPLYKRPSKNTAEDEKKVKAAHKYYYKKFRDTELGRVEMIKCRDKLWRHPSTFQSYSMRFVPADEPFKVPCQVCTKDRYASNVRNIFMKCTLEEFIKQRGGDEGLHCEPLYKKAWEMDAFEHGHIEMAEQAYGDQLADGGGFYLHFFPLDEALYAINSDDDDYKNIHEFSSGIFYCAEDVGEDSRQPEVIQVVDKVSFKEAGDYSLFESKIHRPLETAAHTRLNLQYHIIWQDWQPCCLRTDEEKRVRFGIVTVRKIDPTKTIFWASEAINESTEFPQEVGKLDVKNLVMTDAALSLPVFYHFGIRPSAAFGLKLGIGRTLGQLIDDPIRSSVLFESVPCNVTILAEYKTCMRQHTPKRRPQFLKDIRRMEEARRPVAGPGSIPVATCIPCTIPRKAHTVIEVKGTVQVEYRLHQHLILSCADPNRPLKSRQGLTWHYQKGAPIKECRGLNTTFVINGEVHIHAAKEEDRGTYVCKIRGKQVKAITLFIGSGKWISDFWLYFCIIVTGTLLVLGLLIWCHIIPDCCIKSTGVGMVAQMALDYGRDVMQLQKEEREAQGLEKKKLYVARQLARNKRIYA